MTKDVNIKYLTKFPASESWLFITQKKAFYITDFRYLHEARKGLKGVAVIRYDKSLQNSLFELAVREKVKTLGLDERHISLFQYKKLHKACPRTVKLSGVNNLVEDLRAVKESGEVQKIREALKIHQEALVMLKKVIKPGLSERDVFFKLEEFVKDRNVGFSFDPIIASGPNSAYPHAKVSDRKIRNNEIVLVDIGIDVKGYKSDLTRIFFLGRIPKLISEVRQEVWVAQQLAITNICAGRSVAAIDKIARNSLKEKKLDVYFGHSLGHGVGLEIHENPRLSEQDPTILKEGMVVTVEPGVYIPGKFGIRLEEMVLVTKKGCEVLSGNIN